MVRIRVINLRGVIGVFAFAALVLLAIFIADKGVELLDQAVAAQPADKPSPSLSPTYTAKADRLDEVISVSVKKPDATEPPIEDEHDPKYNAGESIKIEIAGIKYDAVTKSNAPKALIYHTHTYEAYEQDPDAPYVLAHGAQWRTKDYDYNIVRVGEELTKLLEDHGFEVVHDTTAFEPPEFGTAYSRSLDMLEKREANGEKYDIIIDMHRDAYSERSWTPASVTISDDDFARLMFLVGTGEAGFIDKPDWKENYALVDQLISHLQNIDSRLCKDANVKTQRYNQHVSTRCVLVEVGHCENTLEEALASMKHLAGAIDALIKAD